MAHNPFDVIETSEGDVISGADANAFEGNLPEDEIVNNNHGDDVDVDIEVARQASQRLLSPDMGAVAMQPLVNVEHAKRYPAKTEDIIARRKTMVKFDEPERHDAYEELGGIRREPWLSPRFVPLENVLDDDFKPWQKDIRLAIEQFGLAEYSAGKIKSMKPEDLERFSRHFYAYLTSIDKSINFIDAGLPDGDFNEYIRARYGKRSKEELASYRQTLKWLKSDLEDTGVPQVVRSELHIKSGRPSDAQHRYILDEVKHEARRHGKQAIRVVSVRDKLKLEWYPR